eukprot:scaffold768_cov200-Alexandrium_tamarense.AAC.7
MAQARHSDVIYIVFGTCRPWMVRRRRPLTSLRQQRRVRQERAVSKGGIACHSRCKRLNDKTLATKWNTFQGGRPASASCPLFPHVVPLPP